MANDEELKLRITAEDGTAQALRSVQNSFIRTQAELQRGVKTLADGTKVQLDAIQKAADKSGLPFKELLKHIEGNAKAASQAGTTIGKMGNAASGAGSNFGGMATRIGAGNAALATMATRFIGVGSAMEVARRGIVGWAAFDTKLRLIQNQTDMTTPAVHGLGEEIRRLAKITGDSTDDMIDAFNELREAANLSPEDTMKALPGIALAAKGMGATAKTAASITGDAMRNMNVPLNEAGLIMEANSHATRAYTLDLNKLEPHMDKLTESARAVGLEGVDGYQRLLTTVGIAKMSLKDAGAAAAATQRILENMKSDQMGKALGFANGTRFENWLKQQPDQLGAVIHQMTLLEDQHEVMQIAGVRDAGVWRNLLAAWSGEYSARLKVMQSARGALERGKNMTDSPEAAINRLNESVSHLVQTIGQLWDALGGNAVLNTFADIVSTTAESVSKLIHALQWIIGLADRPKWLAKSLGEVWGNIKNFGLPKGENSKTIDQMVPNKNLGGGGGTGGGGGGVPAQVQKMSLAIKDTNESLAAFTETLDRKEGALMRASLYGSSSDARILKASYSPSGQGFISGDGPPGTGGTGGPGGSAFPNAAGPPGSNGTAYGPTGTMPSGGITGPGGDPRGMEAHIRATAAKYGIDPDTAVAVAKSEGLTTFQSSVQRVGKGSYNGREDSWGAFQLYRGGGLGNEWEKANPGKSVRDPANEKDTIDFALKHASKHGWGSWNGAKNTGIAPFAGIGGNTGVGAARGRVAGPGAPGPMASLGPPPDAPGPPGTGGGNLGSSIDQAMKLVGLNESKHRAILADYMKTGGRSLSGEQNAWCAAFVNGVVQQAGMEGTGSWAAKSFLKWGKSVGASDEILKGDVFVFDRGRDPSKGHVGISTGRTGKNAKGETTYEMLQGNHGDSVGTTWHTRGGIKAIRRGQQPQSQSPVAPPPPSSPNVTGASTQQQDVNLNLNVNDTQVQFARASMRRGADREVREARWNSYSDIGAA